MSEIRLYRNGNNEWVFNHQGSEHTALLTSIDTNETFRTLGLHPKGAVCIAVSQGGYIEEISLVDGTTLGELVIPKTHSLHRDLTPA